MSHKLRVALIGGGMYDGLYASLRPFTRRTGIEVEVGFRGPHPELNAHLAAPGPIPYDLVSTHTKYAPSQKDILAPLDDLFEPGDWDDFVPACLDLARIDAQLFGIPRNVDVRLLHYRTDLIDSPPQTWDQLLGLAERVQQPPDLWGFVFPGKESGLFGTFYELLESAGTRLFCGDHPASIDNPGGQWAIGFLRAAYGRGLVPPKLTAWHYDEVHLCFREGRAAMVGDWPGFYGSYRDRAISRIADRFAVCRYPRGPAGISRAYGGSHTFALTRAGATRPEAVELLRHLTAPPQQMFEASQGSVPVRRSVMNQVQEQAAGAERDRWRVLQEVIEHDVVIPPKLSVYPRIEEIIWRTVQQGMIGELPPRDALHRISEQVQALLECCG